MIIMMIIITIIYDCLPLIVAFNDNAIECLQF